MLAGQPANVEQPRLGRLELAPGRRPAPRPRGAILSSASLASISARSSAASASASSGWSAAPRSIRRAASRSCASAPSDPPSNSSSPVSASPALAPPASPRAPRRGAFPRPASAPAHRFRPSAWSSQSRSRSAAAGCGPRLGQLALRSASTSAQAAATAASVEPAERVEQGRGGRLGLSRPRSSCWPWISTASAAMSRSSGGRHAGAAGEGAAAAVGLQRPPQQQRLARLALDALLGQQGVNRMVGGKLEFGGDRRGLLLRCAPARCRRARRAPGRARRAGSTCPPRSRRSARQARLELQLELVDQHDIADRQLPQHARGRRARHQLLRAQLPRRVPLDQL